MPENDLTTLEGLENELGRQIALREQQREQLESIISGLKSRIESVEGHSRHMYELTGKQDRIISQKIMLVKVLRDEVCRLSKKCIPFGMERGE